MKVIMRWPSLGACRTRLLDGKHIECPSADHLQTGRAETILETSGNPVHLLFGNPHSPAPATVLTTFKRLLAMLARFGDRPSHGLELNSRLGLDALSKRMFRLLHLRDEIGFLDQFVLGTTTGNYHMLHRRPATENRQHVFKPNIVMLQRDIELVENDHRIRGIA